MLEREQGDNMRLLLPEPSTAVGNLEINTWREAIHEIAAARAQADISGCVVRGAPIVPNLPVRESEHSKPHAW